MIQGLPNASTYHTYAYHTELLQDFVKPSTPASKNVVPESEGMSGRERRHSHNMSRGLSMRNPGARRHSHHNNNRRASFLTHAGSSLRAIGGNKRSKGLNNSVKSGGSGEFKSIASSHHFGSGEFNSKPGSAGPAGMRKAHSVMIKGL
jgi:hypothetical protein